MVILCLLTSATHATSATSRLVTHAFARLRALSLLSHLSLSPLARARAGALCLSRRRHGVREVRQKRASWSNGFVKRSKRQRQTYAASYTTSGPSMRQRRRRSRAMCRCDSVCAACTLLALLACVMQATQQAACTLLALLACVMQATQQAACTLLACVIICALACAGVSVHLWRLVLISLVVCLVAASKVL